MKKPKVTIIIPVYKGKKYMREAIDSAIAQTYENIEILVINDGSPDNGETDTIARSYGDKIRYIYKENGGVSTVLNLALKEMQGEYFSWLSHDDVYYPKKIEEEINYLVKHEQLGTKVILYSDYDLIDKKSKLIYTEIKEHQTLEEKPEYALLRGHVNGITLLIPKIAFDDCGKFDENLICAQDYELWYRMMKKGYKFIHIPKVLAKTRLHNKQVTNTNPRVVTEGNDFWKYMIDDIPKKTKIRLNGSEYNYYKEFEKFLGYTQYHIAKEHCHQKCLKIESIQKEKLENIMISVVIPFYNRSKLVLRAIKSVTNQTHKNYEVIIVNDGSTENIDDVKKYIEKNNKLKLITLKENKGAANARNIGIDNATGEYIAFLDSDDAFEPNKLEAQLLQMVITNSKVSHTSYNRDINGQVTYMNSGKQNGDVIPELIKECLIATPTVMIERDYLNKNNYRFDPSLVIGEDTCFWLTILSEEKLLGIDKPLTTVYACESSAAYNLDKRIIGLKTILQFVFNNPKLSKYDYEIGMLASAYIYFINEKSKCKDNIRVEAVYTNCKRCEEMTESLSWKITKPIRLIGKAFSSLKRNGIKETIKKIVKKVIKK